jgi:GNAT superfamily N-acetyltransferase
MDSAGDFASSVDSNLYEFIEYAASVAGKPPSRRAGYAFASLRPSPWINSAYSVDPSAAPGFARELARGIVEGSVPNRVMLGVMGPAQRAAELLVEAGFEETPSSRGMTLALADRVRTQAPTGLRIDELAAPGDFESFAAIVAVNLFRTAAGTGPAFASLLERMDRSRAFGYLGRAGDALVCASFAFIGEDGMGGVYFVATEKEHRGKGYGAAIVSDTLDGLERRDAERCILQASPDGKPVYDRLGFRDVGAQRRFFLPASAIAGKGPA